MQVEGGGGGRGKSERNGPEEGERNGNFKLNQGDVNRYVLRDVLKLEKVDFWRTERGSLFQQCGPETEKARGPKVLSLVRGV